MYPKLIDIDFLRSIQKAILLRKQSKRLVTATAKLMNASMADAARWVNTVSDSQLLEEMELLVEFFKEFSDTVRADSLDRDCQGRELSAALDEFDEVLALVEEAIPDAKKVSLFKQQADI